MQPPWPHRAACTRRPVAAAAWRGRDAPYGGRGRLPPRPDQPSLTDLQADAAAWEAAAAVEAENRAADAAASVAELAARRRAARAAAAPAERPPAGSAYGRWRRDEPAQRQRPPPDPFFGDLDAGGRAVRAANERRRRPRPSPPDDTLSPEDAELERLRSAVQAGVARAAAADAAAASVAGRSAAAGARRRDRGAAAAPPPPPTPDGARSTLFDPRARLAAKVAGVLTLAESIRDGREEEGGWWEDGGPPPRRPRRARRRQVEHDW